eukprot:gene31202-14802_t
MGEKPFQLIHPPTVTQLSGLLSDEVEAGTHSVKPLKEAYEDADRRVIGRPGGVSGRATVLGGVMEGSAGLFYADVIAGAFNMESMRTLIAFARGRARGAPLPRDGTAHTALRVVYAWRPALRVLSMSHHYRTLVESGDLEGVQIVGDFECVISGEANIDYATHGIVSGTEKFDLGPRMKAVLDAVGACFDVGNPGQRGDGVFADQLRAKLSGGASVAYVSFLKTADGLDKGYEARAINDVRARANRIALMVKKGTEVIETGMKDYDVGDPSGWVGITFAKQAAKPEEDGSVRNELKGLLSELVGARQAQPVDAARDAAITALITRDQKEKEARDLINRNLSDKDRALLSSLPKYKKPEDCNVYIAVARMVGSPPDHCPMDDTWDYDSICNMEMDPMDAIGDFHGWQTVRQFKHFMKDPRIDNEKDLLFKKDGDGKNMVMSRDEIMAAVGLLPELRRPSTKTSVGIASCRMLDYTIIRKMMADKHIAKEETMLYVLQSDRALGTAYSLLSKRESMKSGSDRSGGGGGGGAKRRPRAFSAGGRQPAHARRREREASREGSPLKILPAAQRGGWAPHVPSKSSGGAARGGKPKQGPAGGCYECGGPHYADKCPTKKKQPRRMIL